MIAWMPPEGHRPLTFIPQATTKQRDFSSTWRGSLHHLSISTAFRQAVSSPFQIRAFLHICLNVAPSPLFVLNKLPWMLPRERTDAKATRDWGWRGHRLPWAPLHIGAGCGWDTRHAWLLLPWQTRTACGFCSMQTTKRVTRCRELTCFQCQVRLAPPP